ncbi:IclR family transcriptional regulator [Nakamurella silvestris]|nr:IclR family transcriptional regulator [Nakamurella silvestris]
MTIRPLPSADGPAPALRRGLAVLTFLASRTSPQSAGTIARELALPRSSLYELLTELAAAGFVVHLPSQRRWGLGVTAFEIGTAYLRQDSLERIGRPVLTQLAKDTGMTAHLGVLHGSEILYVVKERPAAPRLPTLVTEVGVRLPAQLTATGRAVLAHLPAAQVRALFPEVGSFVDRTGRGDRNLPALRTRLSADRQRGWSVEDGQVSAATASVAAPVFDHHGLPTASIGVTFAHHCEQGCDRTWPEIAARVRVATAAVSAAIGGQATPAR